MNIYTKRLRPLHRAWAAGFGAWEGAFWSHVEVFWGPSWGFGRSKTSLTRKSQYADDECIWIAH